MNRISVPSIPGLPDSLQCFIHSASLYDSSCSPDARVWFSDRDGGYYIKTAPAGSLREEARMNAFFHSRGLGAEVLAYLSGTQDWMVTRAIPGEDCLYPDYLNHPERLSETLGSLLRRLHETDTAGCSLPNRTEEWIARFPDRKELHALNSRVLIHGDYCLPNIMLMNWEFSGFLDVGAGGIGDRHVDLYWGCWSILYNLKEPRWCSRFLDAYGREAVDLEKLQILAEMESIT